MNFNPAVGLSLVGRDPDVESGQARRARRWFAADNSGVCLWNTACGFIRFGSVGLGFVAERLAARPVPKAFGTPYLSPVGCRSQ
jgi:hypothetical protein